MKREELREKIVAVALRAPLAAVSTVAADGPKVRYMMMQMLDDMSLCSATFLQSRKVAQVKDNGRVQVIMGGDEKDLTLPHITISGEAKIAKDEASRKRCWREELSTYFSGPEDPNFAVFIVVPDVIEYMEAGAREPEIYDVRG